MNNIYLKRKKFDLVVANLLMNEHKSILFCVCRQIQKKGFLIISGILVNQKNFFIILLDKLNFKLLDSSTDNNWCCLIFKKN